MAMNTTSINSSATYALPVMHTIENAAYRALMFDKDMGTLTWPEQGSNAIGIVPGGCQDFVRGGDYVSVQIKDVAYWAAGDAFPAGAELTTDADGYAVVAQPGEFIIGMALSPSIGIGSVVEAQLTKSGYKYIWEDTTDEGSK